MAAEIFTNQGADGVTYRITSVDSTINRGSFGVPSETEQEWTVEAVDAQSGSYFAAAFVFFQFVSSRHPTDHWGNPLASGGVELQEVADSMGRLWSGRVRYSSSSSAAISSATGEGGTPSSESASGYTNPSDPFSYAPFISSFSTAGGTVHKTVSYNTRAYAVNGDVVDFGGGIGWNGEGYEGVDVAAPSITFDVTVRTPVGFVANFANFLNKTVPFISHVNSRPFYGCSPGTVLFNGITSSSLKSRTTKSGATDFYWEMSYSFAASPNIITYVNGVAVEKYGWEYMWALANDDGSVRAVYCEQVYLYDDFAALGIGG